MGNMVRCLGSSTCFLSLPLGVRLLTAPRCCQALGTAPCLAGFPELHPFLLRDSVSCKDPAVSLQLSPALPSLSLLAWAPALLLAGLKNVTFKFSVGP